MKKLALLLAFSSIAFTASTAQESGFRGMEIITTQQGLVLPQRTTESSQIRNIQALDTSSGIVYTADAIFLTRDGGTSWDEVPLELARYESLTSVKFTDRTSGYAIVSTSKGNRLDLMRTADGGRTWERSRLEIGDVQNYEADTASAELEIDTAGQLSVVFITTTSSNFSGIVRFISVDNGISWQFAERRVESRTSDAPSEKQSGTWTIKTEGTCAGFKSGCVQETRIISGGRDITPAKIDELARTEKEKARAEATPMFELPPGGSTRTSLNRGFDKCQAGTIAQMQLWWDNSPHYDSNIYMSGRNRACPSQPFSNNPSWIDQVSAQGWGLIPTIVGYQSPCTASTTTAKLSYDAAVAEQQGRGEADIAVTDANSIGLTTGSILYYDMERYDPPNPDMLGCRTATVAFLKGWTDRIKELGYKSGTYGSPKNAQEDWVNLPPASRMDAIWMARWDNVPSVWTYVTFPSFPTNVWNNHQRIKQWQAPHNETWAGVT
ncbi:MAG: glycoside hydrolase domain-containing protein, partial [Acidobacteriota bacterium]